MAQLIGNEEEADSADERPVSNRMSRRSHREQQQQQPQPQPPPAPQPSRSSASERKEWKIYGRVSPMTQKQ